jgi:hypothetical protein
VSQAHVQLRSQAQPAWQPLLVSHAQTYQPVPVHSCTLPLMSQWSSPQVASPPRQVAIEPLGTAKDWLPALAGSES